MENSDVFYRCGEFAKRNNLTLGDQLGAGIQGIVFIAGSQAKKNRLAIKAHKREPGYLRERDAYLRLKTLGLTTIRGCNVPAMIAYNDELWIIAMEVVDRPFVLDFGGAYLDKPPDFSDEIWAEWEKEKMEQFGTRWPEVRAILNEFQAHGIFLIDPNPGNVAFGD